MKNVVTSKLLLFGTTFSHQPEIANTYLLNYSRGILSTRNMLWNMYTWFTPIIMRPKKKIKSLFAFAFWGHCVCAGMCILSIICGPHLDILRVVLSLCQIDFPSWLFPHVVVFLVTHCGGRFCLFSILYMLLLIFLLLLRLLCLVVFPSFFSCAVRRRENRFLLDFLLLFFAFLIALCSEITEWQRDGGPHKVNFICECRQDEGSESRAWLTGSHCSAPAKVPTLLLTDLPSKRGKCDWLFPNISVHCIVCKFGSRIFRHLYLGKFLWKLLSGV